MVGLLGHDSFVHSFLKESPYSLPWQAISIYNPTNSAKGSLLSTPSPAFIVLPDFLMMAVLIGVR